MSRAILVGVALIGCTGCDASREPIHYDWDVTPVNVIEPIREVHAWPGGFRSVSAFAADSTGNLYIGDTGFKRLVALDSTGAVIWQRATSVGAVLSSMGTGFGQVAVADRAGRVVIVLEATSGTLLRTYDWIFTSTAPFTNGQPLRIGSDSSLAFGVGNILFEPDAKYPELSAVREYLVSFDGATGQESLIDLPQWTGILMSLPRTDGGHYGYRPPLVPRLVWTLNPQGGWTGSGGYSYKITIHDPRGTDEVWEKEVGPRRPSSAGRDRELKTLEAMGEAYSKLRGREADFAADTIGHFTTMAYSMDGAHLWVGRTYLEPNPVYDVWDADGVFLCSVELDMGGDLGTARRTPPFVVNGYLYHLATESQGSEVPIIKTFQVSDACERG